MCGLEMDVNKKSRSAALAVKGNENITFSGYRGWRHRE